MAAEWLDHPESHDHDAAAEYLALIAEPDAVRATVAALRDAQPMFGRAEDILRAARLARLGYDDVHVRSAPRISDGHHRVYASYRAGENAPIPFALVSWAA